MRFAFIALIAATLVSCGEAPEVSEPETQAEAPMPVEPDGGIGDGAGPPDITPMDGDPGLIPAQFHGVWDYVEGTCALESDMRMEISGNEILFYESIGLVTDVEREGDDAVVTLAMEGEGETWVQRTRLSISGEGDQARLSTSDGDAPKTTDDYPTKRCPS